MGLLNNIDTGAGSNFSILIDHGILKDRAKSKTLAPYTINEIFFLFVLDYNSSYRLFFKLTTEIKKKTDMKWKLSYINIFQS